MVAPVFSVGSARQNLVKSCKTSQMAKVLSIVYILRLILFACYTKAYTLLSDGSLIALPESGDDFDINNGKLLAPILRPRVPGSPGSTYVLNHFVDFFKTILPKWDIAFQNSTSKTPATGDKDIPFTNLIVSRDPPWTTPGEVGRLTLVAHYDSKLSPAGFIGATDSAAPCAILMHAARSVDSALTKKWEHMQAEGVGDGGFLGIEDQKGLQIIFMDGEEAFLNWDHHDSIYGAKALASELEATPHPAMSTYHNALSSISLFLLLDLLGEKNPNVPSWFKTTHWAYRSMATLENRLRSHSLFLSSTEHPKSGIIHRRNKRADSLFLPQAEKGETEWLEVKMEDDHLPFMERGVEILHIIPYPFPRVWHNMDDDGEHLDLDTVKDWATLTTAFIGEWMDLEGFFENKILEGSHNRDLNKNMDQVATSKTEL